MKWAYLTAPDQLTAEMWQDILRQNGIPAIIEEQDTASFLGVSALPCRVKVPRDMLREAEAILEEYISTPPSE